MLKVSDAFNSAFAAPDRELRARVTIGKTVYDSDDLTSINYDSGAMTGEQFSIGSTYMNSAKITFSHLVEGLKQLDEVLVEFGVLKPDGAVEYVKMGTFIVDDKIQMDRNNNTTTIECMDRMTMLGGAYVSKLTYPARIKDVAVEIVNMAGVKANETSFARLSENKINQPTGYTYRDAIGLIAQFQMGFALFDRDGLLDIRTLQDNSFKIDPNQYFLKGLVKNETFFKLNGISCTVVTTSKDENGNETSKTTVLQSGSSSGAQIKLANNVMTQDVLDRMYEALKFTNYYPFTLNWNGNPAVEAGDWLTLEDMQGNEFKVPNMSYTLTFNGGLTASSKAETSTNSSVTYSYGGSMSNIVNEIGGREGAEGNHIYEGTEDQKPLFPKEGDLWYKHVGPDTEEWIYKDGKWEFLTSTKPATDAQKAADTAQKEAEEAKKQANKAVDGANDAVAKAGFANDTATQAKSDAAAAGQQAKDALTSAGTAITDAKKALRDSNSAMVDSAQARKDSATAIKDAADSLTSAKDAINKVGNLTTSVTSQFTTVNNELKSKVNQTDYDKLKGTVTSQQTEINQNASGIKLKADKSYADTINNSVVKNTSSVGLLNDQIALTVSKTELTSKLNGYATQSWSEGKISAAKNEISASVETVQNKVNNMQIGGVNLLLDTEFNNLPQYWTARAGKVTGTFNGHNVIYCDATAITGNAAYVLQQPIYNPAADNRTLPNQWYTLSFYVKGSGQMTSYVYGSFVDTGAGSYIDGVALGYTTGDGSRSWDLTDGWTRHTYTFKSKSSFPTSGEKNVLFSAFKGNKVYIAMPQLEKGTISTDYSPAPEDMATIDWTKSQLDITDKKITAGITTVTNTLNNNIASATANMATTTWTNAQIDAAKTAINLSVEQSITTTENTLNSNIANATKDMATQTWTKGQLSVTNDNVSASVQKLHDTVSGEIATATNDMATKSWTQGKLDLTDSSLTSQISSVQDGLTTKFTALQQTLNGVQITANNAVTQTQYTQLSDQFTTTIANVGAPNLVSMEGWTDVNTTTHAYYTGNQPLYMIDNASTSAVIMARSSRFAIKANTTYTLSFFGFGTSNAKPINVYVLGRKNGETADFTTISLPIAMLQLPPGGDNFTFSGTFTTGAIDNAYVRVDNNGTTDSTGGSIYFTEVQLEEGSVATPYRVSDNQISSQFTQLQKDINLRVQKGDVINQINISPESILIAGQKVHITGQTSIDNAVIKDAMIADIKADKITAGTLNAANVDVINLNANNITAGTIRGANLAINLNTGEVVFQHGRIHSASNNVDVNIDQGYLSTASNDTRVMLKEGQLQLVQPTIFDNSKDPYLQISNSIGGASFNGANIIARDYLVLANRANSDGFFDAPLDEPETFAGLAVGKTSAGRWKPTRIGGAERGIIMRGGTAYKIDSSFMYKESPEIFVGTDGAGLKPSDRVHINGSYVHITSAYWRTASGSANLMVTRDGALVRSTSASKYKTDIIRTNIPDYGDKLLNLPTATWVDIAETKRYRDDPVNQIKPTRNFGMIAEDLADVGLEMLVVRGADGELEGINYDRIGPALIPVIAKLKNEVETLKQKIGGKSA